MAWTQRLDDIDSAIDALSNRVLALTNNVGNFATQTNTAIGGLQQAAGAAPTTAPVHGSRAQLRPNEPSAFDGKRQHGEAWLNSVKAYVQLVPELFVVNGAADEERQVRWAMTYMSAGTAEPWARRKLAKVPFEFTTMALFEAEFKLRFVEESQQEHALAKLDSHGYYMRRNEDVYAYTDNFEELFELAGYSDPLVKVTKYRSGLPSYIVKDITTRNQPDLKNYDEWRKRAFATYEAYNRADSLPTAPRAPAPVPQARPRVVVPAPAPVANHPVPMDVDRTRATRNTPTVCYRCHQSGHIARDCKTVMDVRAIDVIDQVMQQLDSEMLGELVARLRTAATIEEAESGFPEREE
jgi:hypothetical protein